MYNNFTPQLKIEARQGKTFDPNTTYFNTLHKNPALVSFTEELEEHALVKYGDKQMISTIKGVSDEFLNNKMLDSTIQSGSFTLRSDGQNFAVLGAAVQGSLGISLHDQFTPLEIYSPRRDAASSANQLDEFVSRPITPSGVFSVGQEFDDIVIAPIDFVRDLLNQPTNVSSLQINFKPGTEIDAVKKAIELKIGNNFIIKNRIQQNTALYKTLNYERWFIFMILTFVLIIAIFNIIGSLTMLVIDKRKDIAILTSLGANKQLIKGIFFFEGMMISITGCFAGIVLGLGFCILQQRFGLVKMGEKMSILDAYPVSLRFIDFILVFLTVSGDRKSTRLNSSH